MPIAPPPPTRNLSHSFLTHDEILTSIPIAPLRVAKTTYTNPIEALLNALTDFELSIEIRDRLTQAEVAAFDKVFVAKAKELGASNVEGSYSQQLQALKRLTKARGHLRKHCPSVVEELDGLIGRLLGALSGEEGEGVSPGALFLPMVVLYLPLMQQALSTNLKRGPQQIVSEPRPSMALSIASSNNVRVSSDKFKLSSISTNLTHLKRSSGHKLYVLLNDKEGCMEIKGVNAKITTEIGDKKILCIDMKSLGDISDREISIGTKDGIEIVLELRDEKDAEVLIQRLEMISGITAYTARYY